MAEFNTKLYQF